MVALRYCYEGNMIFLKNVKKCLTDMAKVVIKNESVFFFYILL